MIRIEEALDKILSHPLALSQEQLSLERALGRTLAETLHSPSPFPQWDNSAMDGYALRAEDCHPTGTALDTPGCDARPVARPRGYELEVIETIAAGRTPQRTVGPGQCARIMTGAPIPAGANAVLIQEYVERTGSRIHSNVAVTPGQNIRCAGEELAQGAQVLPRGTLLGAGALGLCASTGFTQLPVFRPPRVGVLSTGDEIVAPGEPLAPGQIWSSNTISLSALVQEAGGHALDLGRAGDTEASLIEAFQKAESLQLDLLMTTGGVSVGDFDCVKAAFKRSGMSLDFWKIRVKPGKPLAFGRLGEMPVFGLPGNPVSCMVGFLQFVRPLIRMSMGDPTPFLPVVPARFMDDWSRRPGRNELLRVCLRFTEGGLEARLSGRQGSGMISSMARAQGLALIDSEASHLCPGDMIQVQLFCPGELGQQEAEYRWGGRTRIE